MPEAVTQTVEKTVAYKATEYGANVCCDGDSVFYEGWSADAETFRDAAVALRRYGFDEIQVNEDIHIIDDSYDNADNHGIAIDYGNGKRWTDVESIEDLVNAAHHLREQ